MSDSTPPLPESSHAYPLTITTTTSITTCTSPQLTTATRSSHVAHQLLAQSRDLNLVLFLLGLHALLNLRTNNLLQCESTNPQSIRMIRSKTVYKTFTFASSLLSLSCFTCRKHQRCIPVLWQGAHHDHQLTEAG